MDSSSEPHEVAQKNAAATKAAASVMLQLSERVDRMETRMGAIETALADIKQLLKVAIANANQEDEVDAAAAGRKGGKKKK